MTAQSIKVGDKIETRNGWRIVVTEVQWWSDDDGAVYGTTQKSAVPRYMGTVRGLKMFEK